MALQVEAWSVFRRTPESFALLGEVAAANEGSAVAAACRLPDAPRSPIVCRAHGRRGEVAVEAPRETITERRSRRRDA